MRLEVDMDATQLTLSEEKRVHNGKSRNNPSQRANLVPLERQRTFVPSKVAQKEAIKQTMQREIKVEPDEIKAMIN